MVEILEKPSRHRVDGSEVEPWPDRIQHFAGSPSAVAKSTLAEVWVGVDDPQPDLIETILGIERRIRAEREAEPAAPSRRSRRLHW